jgi:2-desacetyl-2-hydroxyethyl bacteriochlorophyllide A dehydrogenase
VFRQPKVVEIEEHEIAPPGTGQLVIRTLATTISTGTELTILSGDYPPGSKWAAYAQYPFIAGYSSCGEIVEVGDGMESYEVGDRVVAYAPHASHVLLDRSRVLAKVPESVSDEEASTIALGLIAINGIRRAQLELGESVVVYGLGVLGLLTVQLARLSGCRPVIGVDVAEQRLAWAKELGADEVVRGDGDVAGRVAEATGGRMADVLFEVTGNPSIIQDEFRVLRRFGRAVIVSSPRGPSNFDFHDFCNSPSITIIGAHNGSTPQCETVFSQWTSLRNAELYLKLIANGELRVKQMISHRFSWQEAPDVYRRLLDDRGWAGFIIFDWIQEGA